MTETELNAKLDELKTADAQVRRQAKDRRALRRVRRVQRIERRLRIITYGGYAPHRGYLGCTIDEQGNISDGNHIKYPKNSNCQRWIDTPMGKKRWSDSTIISILTNEKYKGDALLQKKFTVDYLTKKTKKNEGEVPQYYVEGSHPAIIMPVEWEAVQAEFARRKGLGKAYSGTSVFSARLVCGDCGDFFGSKVWHSTDEYRKEVWRCNHKFDGGKKCETPHLVTEQIQNLFLQAYNELMQDRTQVIADCAVMRDALLDTSAIQAQIAKVDAELEVTAALVAAAVKENATLPQSQEEYNEKYAAFEERFLEQKNRRAALEAKIEERKARAHELDLFMDTLAKRDLLLETWDDQLWLTLVEKGTVLPDGSINFLFKDGTEILAAE